jgi:hypothetical protein
MVVQKENGKGAVIPEETGVDDIRWQSQRFLRVRSMSDPAQNGLLKGGGFSYMSDQGVALRNFVDMHSY